MKVMEEINKAKDVLETMMKDYGNLLLDYVTETEDEELFKNAEKSIEFLKKLPDAIIAALAFAVYAGEDWKVRKDSYDFGADSFEMRETYLEGGLKFSKSLPEEVGEYYDKLSEFFVTNISPRDPWIQVDERSVIRRIMLNKYEYVIVVEEYDIYNELHVYKGYYGRCSLDLEKETPDNPCLILAECLTNMSSEKLKHPLCTGVSYEDVISKAKKMLD